MRPKSQTINVLKFIKKITMSIKLVDGTIVKTIESTEEVEVTSKSIEAQISAKKWVIEKLEAQIKEAKSDLVEVKKLEKSSK